MKVAKCLCLSIFICMLSAVLFWIGGYNFDARGPEIAFSVAMTLVVAFFTGMILFY